MKPDRSANNLDQQKIRFACKSSPAMSNIRPVRFAFTQSYDAYYRVPGQPGNAQGYPDLQRSLRRRAQHK